MVELTTADRAGIQVTARAASILRAISDEASGPSLGELAARLDLPRSTVQRIVGALIEEGLLVSAGPRAGVTLGPLLTRLAAAAIIDTERLARPLLQELSQAIGETVDLSVLQGANAVFVDQVVGTSRLMAFIDPISRYIAVGTYTDRPFRREARDRRTGRAGGRSQAGRADAGFLILLGRLRRRRLMCWAR